MKRRTLLAGAGSAFTGLATGCLADAVGPGGDRERSGDDPTIPESPSDYPFTTADLEAFDPAGTYRDVSIGSRTGVDDAYGPHEVRIWNDAPVPSVELRITDVRAERVVHQRTYEIPAEEELRLSLLEPAVYIIQLQIPSDGIEQALRVPCLFFDCNESATRIGVTEGGEIRSTVVQTRMGCPSADC